MNQRSKRGEGNTTELKVQRIYHANVAAMDKALALIEKLGEARLARMQTQAEAEIKDKAA